VKQADFEAQYDTRWRELEAVLRRVEQSRGDTPGARRLPPDCVDLPERYRAICRDLSLAVGRRYSPRLLDRLNRLALDGHRVLYTRPLSLASRLARFVRQGFPARVRHEVGPVALAAALFLVPALCIFLTVWRRPDLVYSVFSWGQLADLEAVYDPAAERFGANRDASTDLAMFGFYIFNNIGVAFRCFALGLFLGLGTAAALVLNGLVLGAASAHMLHVGFESTFFPFVIGHGAFELTAIVLSGAAGLRIGDAILAPGPRPRLEALRIAALRSMEIVYGAVAMLVVAAALEAFWSSKASIPAEVKIAVGAVLWAMVIAYLAFSGRGAAVGETRRGP